METRCKKDWWEGFRLINAQQKYSYGGEFYGIYIVLRFILEMLDESNNKPGKIRLRCDNLAWVLDSTQTTLKV